MPRAAIQRLGHHVWDGTQTFMVRTVFAGLGVLFAALVLFCASFFGRLAPELERQGGDYERLAVEMTRDLSKTWSLADIEQHCAPGRRQAGGPAHAGDSPTWTRLASSATPTR